jgi:Na+/melibiose symporter-like transporter
MKYFELELDGETIELRMTTTNAKSLESKTGKSIFELVGDMSVTNISKMLMYLLKGKKDNVCEKEADELVDKLIDNGYTFEKIMMEVIFEALVVSGFLSKEQLEEAKILKEEVKEKNKKKVIEDLQN